MQTSPMKAERSGLGLMLVGVGLLAAGCAAVPFARERADVIRLALQSTVQLRSERAEGARRAGSGVILAADHEIARAWIVTTKHFLEPSSPQETYVTVAGRTRPLKARVLAVSTEADLAMLEVDAVDLPAAALKPVVRLGDEVWIVAFPRGRRATLVSGVVSQLVMDGAVEGPAAMVDASVTYGASGGGVFDVTSGELIGIVEGYRTGRVKLQDAPERIVEIPLPGETTLVSAEAIARFVATVTLQRQP